MKHARTRSRKTKKMKLFSHLIGITKLTKKIAPHSYLVATNDAHTVKMLQLFPLESTITLTRIPNACVLTHQQFLTQI